MMPSMNSGAFRVCENCKDWKYVEGTILDMGDGSFDFEPDEDLLQTCEECGTWFDIESESWSKTQPSR